MTNDKRGSKSTPSSPATANRDDSRARSAHQRDESAQTRDIERMSDKTPDEAEEFISDAEREARAMRTRNEAPDSSPGI